MPDLAKAARESNRLWAARQAALDENDIHWPLGVVAVWRMALYFVFLRRVANLPRFARLIGWLLPPSIIVAVLGLFGMMYVISAGMAGVRNDVDANLASMEAIAVLGMAAWIALPVLVPAYIILALIRNKPQEETR
jgi:glucan phosphoethanolaminetransferase (alkaline phosphatase superfamily)